MNQGKAVGIDPDAKGFKCILLQNGIQKKEGRHFSIEQQGLQDFVKWIQSLKEVIIAIEGANGQSRPIEQTLRAHRIVFHTFKASDVEKYRRAVMGENKDNDKDAEATASLALALDSQGRLKNYKRVWFPNISLQLLTRQYARLTKNKTGEINNLWKIIREASPDFYVSLKGKKKANKEGKRSKFNNKNLLNLLFSRPAVSEWKNLTDAELFKAMGGRNDKGVSARIAQIREIAQDITSMDESVYELISMTAERILLIKKQQKIIKGKIENKNADNKEIQNLIEIKGIAAITASTIMAELIDIRRFVKDDNLASYAGLGRKKDATGETGSEKKNFNYNRRLKNILMTAAKNFVHFNPDHHLSGYFRHLCKTGMERTEAYKRVARSLVRLIFRRLYGLIKVTDPEAALIENEGSMANGKIRDTHVSSNIPPSNDVIIKKNGRKCQMRNRKPREKCLT